jgi:hypothetical protein
MRDVLIMSISVGVIISLITLLLYLLFRSQPNLKVRETFDHKGFPTKITSVVNKENNDSNKFK